MISGLLSIRHYAALQWLFVCTVIVWVGACDAIGIGGQCHDRKTGEVLKEVEDANGKLWPVKKHPDAVLYAGQELEFCGVSVEAATEREDRQFFAKRYVFHPGTSELIEVGSPSKGMRTLEDYEWY